MKNTFLFLVAFLLPVCFGRADNCRFYNSEELASSLISCICQDSDGFLWIGTEYGLSRFNGVNFRNYYTDTDGLADDAVTALTEDGRRRLWIGLKSGIQYYDLETGRFRTVGFEDGSNPQIRNIVWLHTGELLAATDGYGIFQLDEEDMLFRSFKGFDYDAMHVTRIFEDTSDRFWVLTSDKKLSCHIRKGGVWTELAVDTELIHQSYLNCITEDGNGNVWIGASPNLFVLRKGQRRFERLTFDEFVGVSMRSLAFAGEGVFYVGTYGRGLWKVLPESRTVSQVVPADGRFEASGLKVVAVFRDRDQNLWAGCFQRGLLQVSSRSNGFEFWNFESGALLTTLYLDEGGDVLCGLENGDVFKLGPNGELKRAFSVPESVISLCRKEEGVYWAGRYDAGWGTVDVRSGEYSGLLNSSLKNVRIKNIVKDSLGHLYISGFGKGIYRRDFDEDGTPNWRYVRGKDGRNLKNVWINSLLPGKNGRLWIGHYNGIDCYDACKDVFLSLPVDSVLEISVCNALCEDRDGIVWIATNKGLWSYNPGTRRYRHFTTNDGLSNMMVCSVVEDRNGDIWCSTFNGISRISGRDSCRVAAFYSILDFNDIEFIRGAGCHDAENGIVYFGGNKGIVAFRPDSVISGQYDREVTLTGVYVGDMEVERNRYAGKGERFPSVRMAYNDIFTLEFSTMDFVNARNVCYEYRFADTGKGWNRTHPGENTIRFNRLPSGTYTLKVRACINDSYSPELECGITVSPVWYLSGWACLIYICMFGVSMWFVYYVWERKRKEKLDEEKFRFFINIAHELRSPLTLIISPLEYLLKQNHGAEETKALQTMHKNSSRILSLLNQLLDIRRMDKGQLRLTFSETDLVGFVKGVCQAFEFQAGKKRIRFSFDCACLVLPVWIDRKNFDKVLDNLLANAFKFTPDGGEIEVRLDTCRKNGKEYAEVSVLDTGGGIDERKLDKIFERFYQVSPTSGFGIGLNLVQMLVVRHHGTIRAVNRKDVRGSCFIVCIPLGNGHLRPEEMDVADGGSVVPEKSEYPKRLSLPDYELQKKKKVRSRTDYKILVVDDDKDVCRFIKEELDQLYKVQTAPDGKEAVKMIYEDMPDLIVADVVMPEMDGYELVYMLKHNSQTCHIPVILLTSRTETEDRIYGIEQGADAYLDKPFVMEELKTRIHTMLANVSRQKGCLQKAEDEIKSPEVDSNDDLLVKRVMKVIDMHLADVDFTVEMLAREVGLSRVQLHRKLKALLGVSASDLIRNVRLKQAACLLREKKMNVSQAAYAVGFPNQAYFSVAFRKYYGMSPSDYAQNVSS